jgi:hypothetical protein
MSCINLQVENDFNISSGFSMLAKKDIKNQSIIRFGELGNSTDRNYYKTLPADSNTFNGLKPTSISKPLFRGLYLQAKCYIEDNSKVVGDVDMFYDGKNVNLRNKVHGLQRCNVLIEGEHGEIRSKNVGVNEIQAIFKKELTFNALIQAKNVQLAAGKIYLSGLINGDLFIKGKVSLKDFDGKGSIFAIQQNVQVDQRNETFYSSAQRSNASNTSKIEFENVKTNYNDIVVDSSVSIKNSIFESKHMLSFDDFSSDKNSEINVGKLHHKGGSFRSEGTLKIVECHIENTKNVEVNGGTVGSMNLSTDNFVNTAHLTNTHQSQISVKKGLKNNGID